jgi:hypothetical protein
MLQTGSIGDATNTDAQPTCITSCCDTLDTYIGVWYTFPGTGDRVNISTDVIETNFDTEIQIFSGSCGTLACVNGNDNGGSEFVSGLTSEYEFNTEPSTTYYVYVDGNQLDTGSYGIILTCNPCNDYVVTDTADSGPGSLRDVMECAQTGTTITFASSIDGLPINLFSGPIDIQGKKLTIDGNGVDQTIIDGSLDIDDRIFNIGSSSNVTFKDVKIQHGGGIGFSGNGAALSISQDSRVQLVRCYINDHMTTGDGGVAVVFGSLKAVNCIFENNRAFDGGVVKLNGAGYVSFQQSLLYNNRANHYSILNANHINSSIEVLLSTVANNHSINGNQPLLAAGDARLINTIFNNNGSDPIQSIGSLVVRNNLMDMAGSISLDSNYVGQPFFVDTAAGNFQLQDSSMAIDFGGNVLILVDTCDVDNDSILAEFVNIDLLGNPRLKRCRMDIGAYENAGISNEYFVVNTKDAGIGSLRQAILCAPEGATIKFLSTTNGIPIQLTSGQLVIGRKTTLIGNGQGQTIIDGALDNNNRLISINLNKSVEFQNMTFRNGGGPALNQFGGGVRVFGRGKFIACTFNNNRGSNGGAIGAGTAGVLDVINCTFSNNSCGSQGGAINYSFSANVVSSLFYGNSSASFGGAIICSGGNANFINNTIANNSATTAGGGILNNGTIARLDNNIISNNTAPSGPNFFDNGAAGNVTVSRNNLINNTSLSNLTMGVIIGSPTYVNAGGGNYQLDDASLGINLGDETLLPVDSCDVDMDMNVTESLPLDAGGQARIDGCMMDLGALENGTTPCDTGQCDLPIRLTCGIPFDGSTQGGARVLDTYACSPASKPGSEIIHEIVTSGGGDITITLSNMTADLDVYLLSDCSMASSCVAIGDSVISTTIMPGTHYIVVDGGTGVTGSYTLTVECAGGMQSCIDDDILINNPINPIGIYHAIQTISSNTTVSGGMVEYKAGSSVSLNPNFQVLVGADFEAKITPCP